MFISKSFITVNGSATSYHEIIGLEVSQDGTCVARVASRISSDTEVIAWQDRYPVSDLVFNGGGMITAAANYLISPAGVFAGGSIDDPLSNELGRAKVKRWAHIKELREAAMSGGIDTPFGRFDSDPISLQLINGAVTAALVAQTTNTPFEQSWTLQNNSSVDLTGTNMIGVGLAVMAAINAAHQISRTLREAIEAAATVQEVAAIVWPS
jgi:hypothetical protein